MSTAKEQKTHPQPFAGLLHIPLQDEHPLQ